MKIGILCQEEPLFLGPFLQQVIEMHPEKIGAVFVAGDRTGGEKHKTAFQIKRSILSYWHIMEPYGFFKAAFRQIQRKVQGKFAPHSVQGTAYKHNIPIYDVTDPNGETFKELLRELELDTVLNQTELLLKEEVLAIPAKGFVNRHASLLPYFRGRFASFWSHAAKEPSYGVTIHYVDKDIDTGDIILQQEFPEIDPCLPYPEVMNYIQDKAPELFWRAMTLIEDESFEATPNEAVDEARLFPTLADVYEYKAIMDRRRVKRRRKQLKKEKQLKKKDKGMKKTHDNSL